jgi:hypothetical protein
MDRGKVIHLSVSYDFFKDLINHNTINLINVKNIRSYFLFIFHLYLKGKVLYPIKEY